MDRRVYDRSMNNGELVISSGPVYDIRPTAVFFEEEQIIVTVDSFGHIAFFDAQDHPLGFVDVPATFASEEPIDRYGEMSLKKEGNTIRVELPRYKWEDNYPHCDGEHDRWSRYKIGKFHVVFHLEDQKIAVEGR